MSDSERAYGCAECPQSFKEKKHLYKHFQNEHKNRANNLDVDKNVEKDVDMKGDSSVIALQNSLIQGTIFQHSNSKSNVKSDKFESKLKEDELKEKKSIVKNKKSYEPGGLF